MRSIFRFLFGEDIFISYSRVDGQRYATALADELTTRGYTCRIDQYDTTPGADIPRHLIRSLRWSRMMTVVGSPAATESDRVRQEIEEFPRQSGGQVIVISFVDRAACESAVWFPLVDGLPVNSEAPGALDSGTPSAPIVELIENSFRFRTRNQRLRRVAAATLAAIVLMLGIGWWLVLGVRRQLEEVSAERDGVQSDLGEVTRQLDRIEVERRSLESKTADQRRQIEAAANELTKVQEQVQAERAEVERQRRLGDAMRALGDADLRRQARGYTSPGDLGAVLAGSGTLASLGRGSEAQAYLIDALALQPRLRSLIQTGDGYRSALSLASGDRLLVVSSTAGVWDVRTARRIGTLPEEAAGVAVSADGTRFLTVTRSGEVRVREARSLETVSELRCPSPRDPYRFALGPAGRRAALVCGGRIRVVDVAGGNEIAGFSHPGFVFSMRLGGAQGYLAIVSSVGDSMDYRLQVRDARTGQPVASGPCSSGFRTFEVDPLATMVANGCDQSSQSSDSAYCDVSVCRLGAEEIQYRLPAQARSSATFSNDGRLIVTSEGGFVRVSRVEDGRLVSSLNRSLESPRKVVFSADGEYIAGQSGRLVWVMRARSGDIVTMLELDSPCGRDDCLIGLSSDGQSLITGNPGSGSIQLWQSQSVHLPAAIVFNGSADDVSYSPGGRYVIAKGRHVRGSEEEWYRVWDRLEQRVLSKVAGSTWSSLEGRSSALERYAHQGLAADRLERIRTRLGADRRLRLTAGGHLVESTDGRSHRLWQLDTGALIEPARRITRRSRVVAYAAGRYALVEGSELVDAVTGESVFDTGLPVLAARETGLVVTAEYGLAKIWRRTAQQVIGQIRCPGLPTAAAISPDGDQVALAVGRLVQIWSWPLDELTRRACGLIRDNAAIPPWGELPARVNCPSPAG